MNPLMITIVIASLAVIAASYIIVSIKEKSLIHYLTPTTPIILAGSYFFPWIYASQYGASGSTYAYFYYYAAVSIPILTSALVYSLIKAPNIGWNQDKVPVKNLHWYILILSTLIYLPILLKYSSSIMNPRDIYQQSRAGSGIYYFTSILVLDISFIFFLFAKNKKTIGCIFYLLIASLLSILHGSKSQVITFYWLYLLYEVYIIHRRFSAIRILAYLSVPVIMVSSLFIAFQGSNMKGLMISMANYADYSRNAMLVVDDKSLKLQYGLITFESNFYGRVPRIFFPNKPDFYGSFRVATRYYSENELRGIGAPDFGVGSTYYDFGVFAIFYLAAWSAASTYILKGLIEKSRTNSSRANFLLIAFFSGVGIILTGESYTLIEHFIIAYFFAVQAKYRFRLLA